MCAQNEAEQHFHEQEDTTTNRKANINEQFHIAKIVDSVTQWFNTIDILMLGHSS